MAVSNQNKAQQYHQPAEAEELWVDNEIICFIENQIANSEYEKERANQLKEHLFPVFLNCDMTRTAIEKQKSKFGNLKKSKPPICNPNPLEKNLSLNQSLDKMFNTSKRRLKWRLERPLASWIDWSLTRPREVILVYLSS